MGYKTYSCPVEKKCGGCEWLAVPYPIQLKRKSEYVSEIFGDLDDLVIEPIVGMDEPYHCRNKITSPFGRGSKNQILHGLFRKGSHMIVACDSCLVEDPRGRSIIGTIAKLMRNFKIKPYDEDRGSGLVRYVIVRVGQQTNEVLVTIVCAGDALPGGKAFIRRLIAIHPEISTVVLNVNERMTNAILGPKEHVLYGKGWIEDKLCDCTFRISSTSFYQVNPAQAEKLCLTAIDMANLDGSQTVLDAYCGTGTIGIIASRNSKRLIGVERNPECVRDARANARRNGALESIFQVDDAGDFMHKMASAGESVDVVFTDPPRSGCDKMFLDSLCQMSPSRVVYISCNPETQRRDIDYLAERGYSAEKLSTIDMFPHTRHVETVCLLVNHAAS